VLKRRRAILAAALGLAAPGALRAQTNAGAATTLKVIAFDGGWNLPLWAARREGFFAQEGLTLELAFTPNSGALVRGLMDGRHDIALAAIDNLVAYQEGQGDGPPLQEPDLVAVMGVDRGFLSIVAQPHIRAMAELRGMTLSVDSLNTGFAFVLRELLRANGIDDSEVTFVRGGATELRFEALMAGKVDATLLRTPFEIVAADRGLSVLASADTLGPYLGTCAFVRRSWARSHEIALVGFLRAYRRAMQWLADPAQRHAAEGILVSEMRDITPALATRAVATLLAEKGGLLRDLAIDPAGLDTVLALRRRYGRPAKQLGDFDRYVDLSYRAKALAPP
jgi:ABC-type nitrate/sulfonate/bicarbonate transport system substrate-binding protein